MTGPGIFSYSTTPANNVTANTGINWDEGMSPAAVNNSARQNMTDYRNAFNDLIWFRYGKGDLDYSPVYVSGTSIKITGIDVTAVYHVGRRLKIVGSGTGTIYGTISVTAFSTDTTVTIVFDSGSLTNETLVTYISQIPVTGSPLNISSGTFTPTLFGASTAGTPTYALQRGNYRKVGTTVWVWGEMQASLSGASGVLTMGGFPFAQDNTANDIGTLAIPLWTGFTLSANYTTIGLLMTQNTSVATFYQNGSGQVFNQLGQSQIATADFTFTGCYTTAS